MSGTRVMRQASTRRALAVGVAAALLLAACGGDDSDSAEGDGADAPAGDSAVLRVLAYDRLAFDAESYSAQAGEIGFEYVNEGVIPHSLVVEGFEDDMRLLVNAAGDTDSGSVTLEAGDYVIYCDIPGHRAGGMEADLAVG